MPAAGAQPGRRGRFPRRDRGRLPFVGLVLALVVAIVGCSTGSGSSSSSTVSGSTDGGVLRLGAVDLTTADPAALVPTSQVQLIAADLLYDGLTTTDPATTAVEPALASSWDRHDGSGEAGAAPESWTFHLRDGVEFSDGSPVTGADVKASLERLARLGSQSVAGVRLDLIVGYPELVGGGALGLEGVKAVDDHTVEIDLREAYATLPELLAAPDYGVLPASAPAPDLSSSGATSSGNLVPSATSGPYRVGDSSGDVVRLDRVDASSASPSTVELHRYSDLDQAYAAFVDDQLDWSLVPTGRLSDAATLGDQFLPTPFQAELWFGFNLDNPTYQEPKLRQAIAQAVNRTRIVHELLPGRLGLDGTVVEGVPDALTDACGGSCRYDPDAARALLAAAYPDGTIPTVRIDSYDDPTLRALVGSIRSDLEAVGIPVESNELSFADYRQFAISGSEQMFSFGWVGIAPIADSYLGPLFISDSPDNVTGFRSADIDAAIRRARSTADGASRASQYQEIERQVLAQVPLLPIAQFETNQVVATGRVAGWATRLDGTFDVEAVRVMVAGS